MHPLTWPEDRFRTASENRVPGYDHNQIDRVGQP